MDIKDCMKFKESLLNIMNETVILRDLIVAEISKYKPYNETEDLEPNKETQLKEEEKNEDFDLTKKVNKRQPKPINKKIEEVKKTNEVKKTQRKSKKEVVVIVDDNSDDLKLEL